MDCCDIWEKFDSFNNTIKEYRFWKLLVSKKNKTLGCCVIIIKRHIEAFSDIIEAEMDEFEEVIKDTEHSLKKAFNYDKINWLMLMMKDDHLHFHIWPRYDSEREFVGIVWKDEAWPGASKLLSKKRPDLPDHIVQSIKEEIIKNLR